VTVGKALEFPGFVVVISVCPVGVDTVVVDFVVVALS
jgi:hypothetical protein